MKKIIVLIMVAVLCTATGCSKSSVKKECYICEEYTYTRTVKAGSETFHLCEDCYEEVSLY
jgi:hypothetical protein